MQYRPDIDGLRAIAVIPVVVYHAGLGLSGGFVGVDIFFAISGYLITSLLLIALKENRFSLIDFYERRARRLFPALFTVISAATVVAPFVLLPEVVFPLAEFLLVLVFILVFEPVPLFLDEPTPALAELLLPDELLFIVPEPEVPLVVALSSCY